MFRIVTSFAIFSCVLSTVPLFAQSSIPAGVTIPAMLSTTIRSDKSRSGEPVRARVLQDVPLPNGGKISRGATMRGHIVEVNPTTVTLTFDGLVTRRETLPIRTSLRAIASMLAVNDAQIPTNASGDRGTPPSLWNTVQIGGPEVVYGRPGDVLNGSHRVGNSLGDGSVFAALSANHDGHCEGDNGEFRAVWVFASSACGAYGFGDLNVKHFGRSKPIGDIVLTSTKRVDVRSGSAFLLRVIGQ